MQRLLTLLPGESPAEPLLLELLTQAGEVITAFTGRETVPPALHGAQVQLALVMYNRLGTEGESYRHEGGLTLRYDQIPQGISARLRAYRVARLP